MQLWNFNVHVKSLTCRRVLQQLLELRRRQLCASDGHEHAELCELRLDVVLLQKRGERGGGDALGGAVKGALHQVNDDLRPRERQRHVAVTEARAETFYVHVKEPYWSLGRALTPSTLTVRVWLLPRILWSDSTSCCCSARTSASFLLMTRTTKPSSSLLTGTQL